MKRNKELILEVNKLNFSYEDELFLKDISFSINKNQPTIFLGANGAGKSTLFFNLLRVYSPDTGEVLFKGEDLSKIDEKIVRQKMAYLFQNPDDQVFAPTVEEDILFGPRQFGLSIDEIQNKLAELVNLLKIENLLKKNPHHLSYGEKRRVALAGVLIMEPEIIFLDEPLAFLDPLGAQTLIEILDRLIAEGKTIVIATHDLNFAAEWGEKFIILDDGEVAAQGGVEILRDGITTFANTLPIVSQLFKGLVADEELPVSIEEGRELLKKLVK
ncbi:energy-coupling factor ABC transporter ATP-binding protein [Orenia metallireducens]|uniref:energy-coupling factor ABC transporter ATP-binding protein n=1 Tax=Orenia metallireducens TaxID=1413210 RepID=UPI0009F41C7D|nr:ATP-binding cassette domain-containing protein [Orenia metallireducens]